MGGQQGAVTVVVALPDPRARELIARIVEAAGHNAVRLDDASPPVLVDTTVDSSALVLLVDVTALGISDLTAVVQAFVTRRYPAEVVALVDGPATAQVATATGVRMVLERPFHQRALVQGLREILGIEDEPVLEPLVEPDVEPEVGAVGHEAVDQQAVDLVEATADGAVDLDVDLDVARVDDDSMGEPGSDRDAAAEDDTTGDDGEVTSDVTVGGDDGEVTSDATVDPMDASPGDDTPSDASPGDDTPSDASPGDDAPSDALPAEDAVAPDEVSGDDHEQATEPQPGVASAAIGSGATAGSETGAGSETADERDPAPDVAPEQDPEAEPEPEPEPEPTAESRSKARARARSEARAKAKAKTKATRETTSKATRETTSSPATTADPTPEPRARATEPDEVAGPPEDPASEVPTASATKPSRSKARRSTSNDAASPSTVAETDAGPDVAADQSSLFDAIDQDTATVDATAPHEEPVVESPSAATTDDEPVEGHEVEVAVAVAVAVEGEGEDAVDDGSLSTDTDTDTATDTDLDDPADADPVQGDPVDDEWPDDFFGISMPGDTDEQPAAPDGTDAEADEPDGTAAALDEPDQTDQPDDTGEPVNGQKAAKDLSSADGHSFTDILRMGRQL